jgi:hypothetical protein
MRRWQRFDFQPADTVPATLAEIAGAAAAMPVPVAVPSVASPAAVAAPIVAAALNGSRRARPRTANRFPAEQCRDREFNLAQLLAR